MIVIRKISGDVSNWQGDEVVTKPTEYLIYHNGQIIGQVPRERVDEIAFVPDTKTA